MKKLKIGVIGDYLKGCNRQASKSRAKKVAMEKYIDDSVQCKLDDFVPNVGWNDSERMERT